MFRTKGDVVKGSSALFHGISRRVLKAPNREGHKCTHILHLWSWSSKIARPDLELLYDSLTGEVVGAHRFPGHLPSGEKLRCSWGSKWWQSPSQLCEAGAAALPPHGDSDRSLPSTLPTRQSALWGEAGDCVATWIAVTTEPLCTLPTGQSALWGENWGGSVATFSMRLQVAYPLKS